MNEAKAVSSVGCMHATVLRRPRTLGRLEGAIKTIQSHQRFLSNTQLLSHTALLEMHLVWVRTAPQGLGGGVGPSVLEEEH